MAVATTVRGIAMSDEMNGIFGQLASPRNHQVGQENSYDRCGNAHS